jgi:hypothetical protein
VQIHDKRVAKLDDVAYSRLCQLTGHRYFDRWQAAAKMFYSVLTDPNHSAITYYAFNRIGQSKAAIAYVARAILGRITTLGFQDSLFVSRRASPGGDRVGMNYPHDW